MPVSTHAGLDLVPFAVAPHLFSEDFTTARPENVAAFAEGVNYPIYAIDDDCAVLVDGGHVEVVGGGRSEIYNDG